MEEKKFKNVRPNAADRFIWAYAELKHVPVIDVLEKYTYQQVEHASQAAYDKSMYYLQLLKKRTTIKGQANARKSMHRFDRIYVNLKTFLLNTKPEHIPAMLVRHQKRKNAEGLLFWDD